MFTTKPKPAYQEMLRRMRRHRPGNRKELAAYVEAFLGLKIPGKRICAGHDSPLDYLAYAFLGEDRQRPTTEQNMLKSEDGRKHATQQIIYPRILHAGLETRGVEPHPTSPDVQSNGKNNVNRDIIVWANRGGGKTQLGAVASLLESIFLPKCQIRILGGSEEQSQRMYEYLRGMLERGFTGQVAGGITAKGCRFVNGAQVQVLAQSQSSVRGHHVQRLRCDEVELFDRDIWQGAQLITQSRDNIPARLEALSTMHRPYGLMQEIISAARENEMRLFRWCLWEVIEPCRDRNCSQCPLREDCQGRAKNAEGYYAIDDAIAQKRRSSKMTWQAEMLCERPSMEEVVFAEFYPKQHVVEVNYNPNKPLYRAIDFGFSNPLVCLFIQVDEDENVYVIDEHIKSRTTLVEHARLIKERYPYRIEATYCDPAGRQRNEITGTSCVTELVALGIPTRSRFSNIIDGINLVRNFLAPAAGDTRLFISQKCPCLIRAFEGLHYQKLANGSFSELPAKDGVHDHLIDALRYFFINRFGKDYQLKERRY